MRTSRWLRLADDQGDAVLADAAVDLDLLDGRLHLEQAGRVGDRVEHHLLALPGDPGAQDVVLLLRRWGSRSRRAAGTGRAAPRAAGRCLRTRPGWRWPARGTAAASGKVRPSTVTWRSCIASSSAACVFGRRAVDLVGQQQAGEQRALAELEVADALVVDERAGEVGRQQVGGELGPGELDPERLRERARGQGLAEARGSPRAGRARRPRMPARTSRSGSVLPITTEPTRWSTAAALSPAGLDARAGHSSSILRTASPSWATV